MTKEEEKALIEEARKAIEAAKFLADYCNNTSCDLCPFMKMDKNTGTMVCRITPDREDSAPFTWWYILEDVDKEWKEFMEGNG